MDESLKARISSCSTLPTIPAIASRIVDLCRTDSFTASTMSELLVQDPAIAARVLQVANSSLYSPRAPVKTVRMAVAMLGANTVMALALGFSLVGSPRPSGPSEFDYPWFWRRVLLSGIAGRVLSTHLALDDEEIFLASLFQDVGMLVMDSVMPEYAALVAESCRDHLRLERMERERFGTDHVEVGAWMIEKWRLPAYISEAIRGQARCAGAGRSRVCSAVTLSSLLAEVWMTCDPAAATQVAAERALEWLGLKRASVSMALAQIAEVMPTFAQLFHTPLLSARESARVLSEARDALVEVTLRAAQRAMQSEAVAASLANEKRQAEDKVLKDALTGLFGRSHLDATLRFAHQNALDYDKPVTVAFCDVDHFKSVNDNHGHLMGDRVLVAVARVLERCVRQDDVVGRFGGEEFVLVLTATDEAGAAVVAERIRAAVEELRILDLRGDPVRVTISIGLSTSTSSWRPESVEQLVDAADTAMYRAKREGRNRVRGHVPGMPVLPQEPVPPPGVQPSARPSAPRSSGWGLSERTTSTLPASLSVRVSRAPGSLGGYDRFAPRPSLLRLGMKR